MMAAVTASMAERTGRTLEDWVEEVHKAGLDPLDQKSVRAWLKTVAKPRGEGDGRRMGRVRRSAAIFT